MTLLQNRHFLFAEFMLRIVRQNVFVIFLTFQIFRSETIMIQNVTVTPDKYFCLYRRHRVGRLLILRGQTNREGIFYKPGKAANILE